MILFDCRLEQAKSLMQQVVNQISQHPFYWEGKIYRVGASAGITRIGGDAKSSELLAVPTSPATPPSTTAAAGLSVRNAAKQLLERQHELLNPQGRYDDHQRGAAAAAPRRRRRRCRPRSIK